MIFLETLPGLLAWRAGLTPTPAQWSLGENGQWGPRDWRTCFRTNRKQIELNYAADIEHLYAQIVGQEKDIVVALE